MADEIKNNDVEKSVGTEVEGSYSASMKAKEQGHRRILLIASIALAISMAMGLWLRFGLNYGGAATDKAQVESVDSLDISEKPDTDPNEGMLKGIVIAVATLFVVSMLVGCYESNKISLLQEQKKRTCQ